MDNLTHTLTGIALGQAGLKRKTRYAMLALVVGSNLPDLDIVTAARGSINYLHYHRGLTHSLAGFTALAALLTAAVWLFARKTKAAHHGPPLNVKWLFVVCWIATACHVLMDYTNDYGVRPFLPWSGRWVAWDIMPVVDPWVLLFLIFGLGLPVILRLVAEEVGAGRADRPAGRTAAMLALCAIGIVWGIRGLLHHRAIQMLEARVYNGENPSRLGAFPTVLSPFAWNGVVETHASYFLLPVDALGAGAQLEDAEIFPKAQASPALAAARATQTAQIFLNFARFPWATVDETAEGATVRIRDLRFISPGSGRGAFVVRVDLNRNLRVEKQAFTFHTGSTE